MKTVFSDLTDWLRREAQISVGAPFTFDNVSCLPVMPETAQAGLKGPLGFLTAQHGSVQYVSAPEPGQQNPYWERLSSEWKRLQRVADDLTSGLPAEYWYG
jgi:hypothetical protein